MVTTVGKIIKSNSLSARAQKSSTTSSRSQTSVAVANNKRREYQKLVAKYNTNTELKVTSDPERCFLADAPSMVNLRVAYGYGAAEGWLSAQLLALSVFCGKKFTQTQLQTLASTIATRFYFLKMPELMLFFANFKGGVYGHFYGNIDPMVITSKLSDFLKERSARLEVYERECKARDADEKNARDKANAITYEQYKQMKEARHG